MMQKAKLSLLNVDLDRSPEEMAAQIVAMFRSLTGREASPAELDELIAQIRADLQQPAP